MSAQTKDQEQQKAGAAKPYEPEAPRPKVPFVPGPLISEPDEAMKVAVPLPPKLKK